VKVGPHAPEPGHRFPILEHRDAQVRVSTRLAIRSRAARRLSDYSQNVACRQVCGIAQQQTYPHRRQPAQLQQPWPWKLRSDGIHNTAPEFQPGARRMRPSSPHCQDSPWPPRIPKAGTRIVISPDLRKAEAPVTLSTCPPFPNWQRHTSGRFSRVEIKGHWLWTVARSSSVQACSLSSFSECLDAQLRQ